MNAYTERDFINTHWQSYVERHRLRRRRALYEADPKVTLVKLWYTESPRIKVPICANCEATMLPRRILTPHMPKTRNYSLS